MPTYRPSRSMEMAICHIANTAPRHRAACRELQQAAGQYCVDHGTGGFIPYLALYTCTLSQRRTNKGNAQLLIDIGAFVPAQQGGIAGVWLVDFLKRNKGGAKKSGAPKITQLTEQKKRM